MTIKVKVPGGIAEFPDGTSPEVMKAALTKKFPKPAAAPAPAPAPTDENTGQGPVAPQGGSLLNIPTDAGNTPVAAAVTSMQQGGNPGPQLPPPQGPSPPQQQPAAQPSSSTPEAAPQAPQSSGNWLIDAAKTMAGSLEAFGSSTLNHLPVVGPGLTTISQGAEVGLNHLLGSGPQDMTGVAQQQQQAQQDFGLSSNIGTVAGTVAPALIPGLGEIAAAAPGASAGANVLRAMEVAGGTGAADTLARTGDLTAAAYSGVTSALAGPVLGKVAGIATEGVKNLAAPARRAWGYVASKIGMTPDELITKVQDFNAQNGRMPSVQEMLDAKSAGGVKDFANSNPEAAMQLQAGQRASVESLPAQAAATVEAAGIPAPTPKFLKNIPANAQAPTQASPVDPLLAARDTGMKAAMAPIAQTPVELDLAPLLKKKVYSQLPDETQKLVRDAAKDAGDSLDDATVTVPLEQADAMRQTFRGLQQTPKNRKLFRGLAEDTRAAAVDQVPAYGTALDDFAAADNYRLGFNHAQQPGAVGSDVADQQQRALLTPEGLAGHQAGVMTTARDAAAQNPAAAAQQLEGLAGQGTANKTIAGIRGQPAADAARARAQGILESQRSAAASTPNAIKPEDDSGSTRNLVTGAGEMAAGLHLSGLGRFGRAISSFMFRTKFAPAVQREIGLGLTSHDPAIVNRTIGRLRQMHVDAHELQKLQAAWAVVGAGAASNEFNAGNESPTGVSP